MKKDFAVISCICLCLAVALVFPRLSASYPMVNESGCRECHDLGEFSLEGLHGVQLNCFACHDGPVQLGNVNSSACLACHPGRVPDRNADKCDLIVAHEGNPNYMPSGASCLSMGCHSEDCNGVPSHNHDTTACYHLSIRRNLWGRVSGGHTLKSSP